jgi:SMC interacting uncharacterized protein involved in chromosome segregation
MRLRQFLFSFPFLNVIVTQMVLLFTCTCSITHVHAFPYASVQGYEFDASLNAPSIRVSGSVQIRSASDGTLIDVASTLLIMQQRLDSLEAPLSGPQWNTTDPASLNEFRQMQSELISLREQLQYADNNITELRSVVSKQNTTLTQLSADNQSLTGRIDEAEKLTGTTPLIQTVNSLATLTGNNALINTVHALSSVNSSLTARISALEQLTANSSTLATQVLSLQSALNNSQYQTFAMRISTLEVSQQPSTVLGFQLPESVTLGQTRGFPMSLNESQWPSLVVNETGTYQLTSATRLAGLSPLD